MTTKQKSAIFIYANKSILILCTGKEKVNEIIQRFITKFNPDSKIIDYNFYYEGNVIDADIYEKTIEDNKLFGKKESFIISVEKNIKVIKCPKCIYGDCVISLINYKATFYNCEYKHLFISSYDNYYTDQIFFPEKIICSCNNCYKNEKIDPNFSLCVTCSKLLGRTKSLCNDCINKHIKEYKGDSQHIVIKYEDKNYYCKAHIQKMEKYCFQCKKNLCESCVDEHLKDKEKYKDHQIKSIDLLIPEKEEITELKSSLKKIKNSIDTLKIVIEDLIYTFNAAMRIYKNYYKIANSIIEKYELFNIGKDALKNFTIFKSLHNLKLSNKQILDDLNSIINEKDKFDKAMKLIGIYTNNKKNFYGNDKEGNDLNKEDDSDWFKDICEKEKRQKMENEKEKYYKETANSSTESYKKTEEKKHYSNRKKQLKNK